MSPRHVSSLPVRPVESTAGLERAFQNTWSQFLKRLGFGGWLVTALVTFLAGTLRLVGLDRISDIIFDETYYAKDAWSLLRLGYEGTWAENSNSPFSLGSTLGLGTDASFVVHPPLGRWLIALGYLGTGIEEGPSAFGWRIGAAIAGTVAVFLVCRIAWLITRSNTATLFSGLFLATDGMHVVMSRVALLDIFMTTFILVAVWALVKDGQRLEATHSTPPPTHTKSGTLQGLVQSVWVRPYLIVAGAFLGAAIAVKWSGLWALAAIGVFVVVKDWGLLVKGSNLTPFRLGEPGSLEVNLSNDEVEPHANKKQPPRLFTAAAHAFADFIYLVGTATLVYFASWWSWFSSPNAWGRPGSGRLAGNGGALSDWVGYHQQIWGFHQQVADEHPYQSDPLSWLLQTKPTLFYYDRTPGCGGGGCVETVSALGNPLMWWFGIVALVWATLLISLAATRIRRSSEPGFTWNIALLLTVLASLFLPWFMYPERTKFSFYAVSFAPYVALLLGFMLVWFTKTRFAAKTRWVRWAVWFVAGLIVAGGLWFLPATIGLPLSEGQWNLRSWLIIWH